LGERENSVYGEKADIMFAGELTSGDSNAIVDIAEQGYHSVLFCYVSCLRFTESKGDVW